MNNSQKNIQSNNNKLKTSQSISLKSPTLNQTPTKYPSEKLDNYDVPVEETKDLYSKHRKHKLKPLNSKLDSMSRNSPGLNESRSNDLSMNASYYKDDPITNYGDLGNNLESLVKGLEQRRKEEERRLKEQRENGCTVS